jgi:hypothetical protein
MALIKLGTTIPTSTGHNYSIFYINGMISLLILVKTLESCHRILSIEYLYGDVPPVTFIVTVVLEISILRTTGSSEACNFYHLHSNTFSFFQFYPYVPTLTFVIAWVVAPVLHSYPSNPAPASSVVLSSIQMSYLLKLMNRSRNDR